MRQEREHLAFSDIVRKCEGKSVSLLGYQAGPAAKAKIPPRDIGMARRETCLALEVLTPPAPPRRGLKKPPSCVGQIEG